MALIKRAALKINGVVHSLPGKHTHSDIQLAIRRKLGFGKMFNTTYGFLDDEGNFLTREQAWHVALAAGQIINVEKARTKGSLTTEDLF